MTDKNPAEKEKVPELLKRFLERGQTVFRGDDGDWEVRLEHSADSVYRKNIPADALIIAGNGCGDCLFMLKNDQPSAACMSEVYVYWHEEQRYEIYSEDIKNLTDPPPAAPSDYKTVFYSGGTVEVELGDEVSARDFLFRKEGRIVYIPGVSKKNRHMEHNGLVWVGIRFQGGAFIGTLVDPQTFQLKKSVRFIQRSKAKIEALGPDEDIE